MKTLIIVIFAASLINLSSCATRVEIQPSSVTVIRTLPASYKVVRVKGKRYYHCNGNHYRKVRGGYVLVRF